MIESVSFVTTIPTMRNFLLLVVLFPVFGCHNLNRNRNMAGNRAFKAAPGWDSVGDGIEGVVNAMAVYNGNLYVAGSIDSAGNKPVQGIAMWDGSHWAPVGGGISGVVNSLVVYNNELYAGGFFDKVSGREYSCLAKWNGVKWSDVDTLMDVKAMAACNGKLYATGFNDSNENKTTHTIGCWNGRDWEAMDNLDSWWEVNSLCAFNNTVYGGGRMGSDTSLIVLSKYGWSVVPRSFRFEINTMLVYNGELYVAGSDVNGNGSSHVVKWDGKIWRMPGTVLKGNIKTLAVYNGKIYAGGQFAYIDDKYAGCLAVLNDSAWTTLSGGVNLDNIALEKKCPETEGNLVMYIDTTPNKQGIVYRDTLMANITVNAMTEYKGELYIGGKFDIAGGIQANNIARYKEPAKKD